MADFWDFVAKKDGRQRMTRWLFTVGGAGSTSDTGYQADIAKWLIENTPYWRWEGVDYPAVPIPEGASVKAGIAELERLLGLIRPTEEISLLGYSEGAIVTSTVYNRMKSGVSPVSYLLPQLKIAATLGNPLREQGKANGNRYAGWETPGDNSRGIATEAERIKNTPDWWYDFAHPGDIYTDTPNGNGKDDIDYLVGQDMTMIYRFAQDPVNLFIGPNSFLEQIMNALKSPLRYMPAAVLSLWQGIKFLMGPWPTYQHTNYDIAPIIGLLANFGEKVAIGQ